MTEDISMFVKGRETRNDHWVYYRDDPFLFPRHFLEIILFSLIVRDDTLLYL